MFLYPFLNTISKTRPFEYLRLTSLGVIGALVKVRPGGTVCLQHPAVPAWLILSDLGAPAQALPALPLSAACSLRHSAAHLPRSPRSWQCRSCLTIAEPHPPAVGEGCRASK